MKITKKYLQKVINEEIKRLTHIPDRQPAGDWKLKAGKALKALGRLGGRGQAAYGVYNAIKTAKTPTEAAKMIGWEGLSLLPVIGHILLGYEGQKIQSEKDFKAAYAAAREKEWVEPTRRANMKSTFGSGGPGKF